MNISNATVYIEFVTGLYVPVTTLEYYVKWCIEFNLGVYIVDLFYPLGVGQSQQLVRQDLRDRLYWGDSL